MNDSAQISSFLAPIESIEPHASLLHVPPGDQLLYKVITVENLLRSVTNSYLHFNRVDSYSDFPNADDNDGAQLPKDKPFNGAVRFKKAPDFSAADYYDRCRGRTYACSFSVENSNHIWENYASGSERGKACLVFEFGKLRAMVNAALNPEVAVLLYQDDPCRQIFSVNYGLVNYVAWSDRRHNGESLDNPILYTYLKDERFCQEKELRISLSTIGMGHFALQDGSLIEFPPFLQLEFDFRSAIANGTLREILFAPEADSGFLMHQLSKLRIVSASAQGKTSACRLG